MSRKSDRLLLAAEERITKDIRPEGHPSWQGQTWIVFKAAPATLQSMYAPEFAAYSAGHLIAIK